jgi:hypothetical protein
MTTEDDLARVTELQARLDALDADRAGINTERNAIMRALRGRGVTVARLVEATVTGARPQGLHRTMVHDIVKGVTPASERFRHPHPPKRSTDAED